MIPTASRRITAPRPARAARLRLPFLVLVLGSTLATSAFACGRPPFAHWVDETARIADQRSLSPAQRHLIDGLLTKARDTTQPPWHSRRERALREARTVLGLVGRLDPDPAELAPAGRDAVEHETAQEAIADLDALIAEGRKPVAVEEGVLRGKPETVEDLRAEAGRRFAAGQWSEASFAAVRAQMKLGVAVPKGACGAE